MERLYVAFKLNLNESTGSARDREFKCLIWRYQELDLAAQQVTAARSAGLDTSWTHFSTRHDLARRADIYFVGLPNKHLPRVTTTGSRLDPSIF